MLKYPEVTGRIIDAALKVHSAIGPGVLESVYKTCLAHELRNGGIKVMTEVVLPVVYQGIRMDSGYRIDLLVEDLVIVELIGETKICEQLGFVNRKESIHAFMKEGIKRILNNRYRLAEAAGQN